MNKDQIKPEKITKPIQLLAAWLLGLISIECALLTASGSVNSPDWLPGFYGISAVAIIPIFLLLIFLLQTRYRPEMQEDEYYAQYLNKYTKSDNKSENLKSSEVIKEKSNAIIDITKEDLEKIKKLLSSSTNNSSSDIQQIITESEIRLKSAKDSLKWSNYFIMLNTKIKKSRMIEEYLKTNGVSINDYFGEDEPDKYVVTFSLAVDIIYIIELLKWLRPFGISYFNFAPNDPMHNNRIYIGAYGYEDGSKNSNLQFINDEILDQMTRINSLNELHGKIIN